MDTLLNEITNLRSVKSDSSSLSRYASRIQSFVNNMEQNGCHVTSSSEAPFVMSQLLSKLRGKDSVEFGREMRRTGKRENVTNLIDWLLNEASLRSRIKRETNYPRSNSGVRSDNHANDSDTNTDEKCPLGCELRHLLSEWKVLSSPSEELWKFHLRPKCSQKNDGEFFLHKSPAS